MNKIIKIVVAVVGVLSIILLGRIINTGDETIQNAAAAGDTGLVNSLLDPMAFVAYIVLAIILGIVALFSITNLIGNKANLMKTVRNVGAFVLLGLICFFVFANGVETPLRDGEVLSANGSKWVGAGLYMFYCLAAIAVGSMFFSGIKKLIK